MSARQMSMSLLSWPSNYGEHARDEGEHGDSEHDESEHVRNDVLSPPKRTY